MKQYSAYKDSGVEWIGEIPIQWNYKRLKYLVEGKLEYGANEVAEFEDVELPRYIRITDFGDDGNLRHDTFKSLTMEQARGYFLAEGDVLFARSGATVGKTFQFKQYKGRACFAGYLIKARPNRNVLLSDFLYLFTKSGWYENWKDAIFNQATIQNIGADKYQNISLPVPSLQDQELICQYLNRKTAQIDGLIAKKERMIELLKEERAAVIDHAVTRGLDPNVELKDSGIDWLGTIPKHWEIKKLKYVSRKIGSGITPKGGASVYLPEGIPILRSQNIHFDKLKLDDVAYISEDMHKEMSATRVLQGDVLLNITGASIGRCNFWRENKEANVNQHVCIIRPNSQIETKYLNYCLSSEIGQRQIDLSQNGISREGLNFEELGDFLIPLPVEEEQDAIVKFLDRKTAQIDEQVAREDKSIELLKEFRTTLISEVVTGKIGVRE